jgi:hypothetical protein
METPPSNMIPIKCMRVWWIVTVLCMIAFGGLIKDVLVASTNILAIFMRVTVIFSLDAFGVLCERFKEIAHVTAYVLWTLLLVGSVAPLKALVWMLRAFAFVWNIRIVPLYFSVCHSPGDTLRHLAWLWKQQTKQQQQHRQQ